MNNSSHSTGAPAPAITRRAAIVGALASTAALAVPAVAAVTATSEIDHLMAKHREAVDLDEQRWRVVDDIDATLAGKRPVCRVQTGRLLKFGRNEDGTDNWDPIYSYTVEQIEKKRDEDIDHLVRFHCWGEHAATREKTIREKRKAWADAKIAELRVLEAEAKRVEDEAGYTGAVEAARASTSAVRVIEQEILALVPTDLAVAAKKARWAVDLHRSGDFLGDGDELLVTVLDTIAKAVRHA